MKTRPILFIAILMWLLLSSASLLAQNADQQIEETLTEFLDALSKGDKERFEAMFTAENTVFSPFPWSVGRSSVQDSFAQLFEMLSSRPSGQSNTGLQAEDLLINTFGNVAIATFHLNNRPPALGRRTVILVKEQESWKVQHLHASSSQTSN